MDSESAFRAVMGALLEFQGAVSNRFDRVDAKLAEHGVRLDGVEFHLGSLDRRVGHIETRMESLETRFGSMEIRFGEMESTMEHIGGDVKQLQRRLPAY